MTHVHYGVRALRECEGTKEAKGEHLRGLDQKEPRRAVPKLILTARNTMTRIPRGLKDLPDFKPQRSLDPSLAKRKAWSPGQEPIR